ncbi:phage virion morphogenesis protein, partial [Achromobacter xylosoxidans]
MVQATIRYEGQRGLDAALARLAALGRSPRPIFKAIANYGESSTRLRFERQRGPDGSAWAPSRRVQKSGGQTLVKSRRLLRSITNVYGDSFAAWGSNVAYARIHQLGGEINRAPYSTRIRLRTDARGNLARQPGNRNLAVFARDSHKRARTSWHEVRAYKI